MSLLVVGSVALDTVETPFGGGEDLVGGSATYFSLAASYFGSVSLVAVVGQDFPDAAVQTLRARGVDLEGLEVAEGRTFRWAGRYEYDLNQRTTLDTQLNVFESFSPKLSAVHEASELVFLGNIEPGLQRGVLDQVTQPKFTAMDTMNFWIEGTPEKLQAVLEKVDCLIINDSEARELSGEPNIIKAAAKIRTMGPKMMVIKRGEYGAALFHDDECFFAPAYPLGDVVDPTGAGDSFAGGFMGSLAEAGTVNATTLRQAVVYGTVTASFCVEKLGPARLTEIDRTKIDARFQSFRHLTHFEEQR